MRLLKFIEDNPGVDERTILRVMTKLLKASPRLIREYLSELDYQGDIENRDGKFYTPGYGEKTEEKRSDDQSKA